MVGVNTGNPLINGFGAAAISGKSRSIEEFGDYVLIISENTQLSKRYLTFFEKATWTVAKEFEQTGIAIYDALAVTLNGVNLMIIPGSIDSYYTIIRTQYSDLAKFTSLTETATVFTALLSDFLVEDTTVPNLIPRTEVANDISPPTFTVSSETVVSHDRKYFTNATTDDYVKSFVPLINYDEPLELG